MAAGLAAFPTVPAPFAGLPSELVSHVSEHGDLRPFAGRRVVVIGAGQSALESAALLFEARATVEVLAVPQRSGGWTRRVTAPVPLRRGRHVG